MWSSSANKSKHHHHSSNRATSSSLSKSSSCASTPSSSPGSNTPAQKSMEEVWKDISLPSLQERSNSTGISNPHSPHFPGLILQDFFSRPFNKDPPRKDATDSTDQPSILRRDITPIGSLGAPHRGTTLSLNCAASDHQHLEGGVRTSRHQELHACDPSTDAAAQAPFLFAAPHNSPFEVVVSSPVVPSLKRHQEYDDNSDDRRHKRMIKNRESAARSRARKQAYTTELELEVDHLLKENAKLRKQQQELLAASAPLPKKRTLYRTSTAPF